MQLTSHTFAWHSEVGVYCVPLSLMTFGHVHEKAINHIYLNKQSHPCLRWGISKTEWNWMEWMEWSGNLHSHMTADVCAPTVCSTPCYALQVTKIMTAWQLFVELIIASWARRQAWGDADATAIHVTQPHHVIILTRPSLYRVNFLAIVMLITHRFGIKTW